MIKPTQKLIATDIVLFNPDALSESRVANSIANDRPPVNM